MLMTDSVLQNDKFTVAKITDMNVKGVNVDY